MTYTTWLKTIEGFHSREQYDYLLNSLPYEARRKVIIYYREKYSYYLNNQPQQLELDIN